MLHHTQQTCKTDEQSLAAILTPTRHKIEAGKRREEAGKEREQRLANSIDECGRQLQRQTQETTEAKMQLAGGMYRNVASKAYWVIAGLAEDSEWRRCLNPILQSTSEIAAAVLSLIPCCGGGGPSCGVGTRK